MPSYKVLKSVAHNLGHSFLSLMNYGLDDYVVEHLFKAARAANKPHVRIDLMDGVVQPVEFRTPAIQKAVARYRAWLPRMVQSEGSSPEFVRLECVGKVNVVGRFGVCHAQVMLLI